MLFVNIKCIIFYNYSSWIYGYKQEAVTQYVCWKILLMNLIFKFSKSKMEKCHLQKKTLSFSYSSIGNKDKCATV